MHEIKSREIEYSDGSKFVVKSLNGEEFDELMNKIIVGRPDGSTSVDVKEQNRYFLKKCVIEAPYKNWSNMSESERLEHLNKKVNLKVRAFLLNAIRNDNIGDGLKK